MAKAQRACGEGSHMTVATKVGLLGATFLTAFGLAAPAMAQDQAADTCPPGTTQAADGTCEEEE